MNRFRSAHAPCFSYGEKTLRAAIHGRSEHLPPLPAKRGSKRELFVLYDDLVEWAKSLPDA